MTIEAVGLLLLKRELYLLHSEEDQSSARVAPTLPAHNEITADRKGVLSFGKWAGMYALAKDKARSHAAHDRRCSRQAKSPPNVIDGFDASAMCAHKVRHLELFHLVRSMIDPRGWCPRPSPLESALFR